MRFRLLIFLLSCYLAGAAVTFDSKFEKGADPSTSPFSFVSNAGTVAGTVGSNSNRVLIGYVSIRGGGYTITTMTWNVVAMTSIGSVAAPDGSLVHLFGLIAPATGNQTISVSWSGGAGTIVLGAISVYNANQSTGWSNFNSATGTSTSMSVTITTASGDMAVGGAYDNNATTTTITSGTSDWNERAFNGNYQGAHNAASGASTNLSWTLGSSVAWAAAGVRVLQLGSSPSGLLTLGAGK